MEDDEAVVKKYLESVDVKPEQVFTSDETRAKLPTISGPERSEAVIPTDPSTEGHDPEFFRKALQRESKSIDRKFQILATSRKSGKTYTDNEAVLFLAKDKAFLRTLPDYKRHCIELGADEAQLHCIDLLTARVITYQETHPDEVKVPDVDANQEAYLLDVVPGPVPPLPEDNL